MARVRDIQPDLYTDEKIQQISLSARFIYIGTFSFADDEGRFEWNTMQLTARIVGFCDGVSRAQIAGFMQELVDAKLVVVYSVAGKDYAFHPAWFRHQHPSKFYASKIPEPKNDGTCPAYFDGLEKRKAALSERATRRDKSAKAKVSEKSADLIPPDAQQGGTTPGVVATSPGVALAPPGGAPLTDTDTVTDTETTSSVDKSTSAAVAAYAAPLIPEARVDDAKSQSAEPGKSPPDAKKAYEPPPVPASLPQAWPTEVKALKRLAIEFLGVFGNSRSVEAQKAHGGAYTDALSAMRSRCTPAEAWRAFGDCAVAHDGKPLFAAKAKLAMNYLPISDRRNGGSVSQKPVANLASAKTALALMHGGFDA